MSKLEELINQLCPDGVEHVRLGDCFEVRNGYTPSKTNAGFWENGTIPWFRLEDIRQNGRILSDAIQHITPEAVKGGNLFPADSIIISTTATIGEHALITVPALTNQQITCLSVKEQFTDKIDIKFIFHYCAVLKDWCIQNANKSGGMAIIGAGKLKDFCIPLPPLPVQEEIVRILDNMTSLTAELTAELKARQKQYEYYRDSLLSFDEDNVQDGVRWMKLGDACTLKAGKHISALDIYPENNEEHSIPCYGGNGIRGFVVEYSNDGNHPIIGRQGALCGNVCYASGKFYATEHAVVVTQHGLYNERFLYYLLDVLDLNQYKSAGAQPGLAVGTLEKIVVPVPPLEEQQRIVDILDRFDKLCNDISEGLPAEIEARKKQYEYYRDKLLTFKEKEN